MNKKNCGQFPRTVAEGRFERDLEICPPCVLCEYARVSSRPRENRVDDAFGGRGCVLTEFSVSQFFSRAKWRTERGRKRATEVEVRHVDESSLFLA